MSDPREVFSFIEILASPTVTAVFFVWLHFEIKTLQKDVAAIKKEMKDNGFLKKDMAEMLFEQAKEEHDEFDKRISKLEQSRQKR